MRAYRFLALLMTTLALAPAWAQSAPAPARKATTTGPDMTGLWHVPAETGWGVNVIQQNKTLLVTLFVYGADGKPLWFVGSDVSLVSIDGSGNATYSGELYQTSGTPFGAAAYDSSSVQMATVGNVTLRFSGPDSARLAYSVNGATVTKDLVPYTFRVNDLTGLYLGSAASAYLTPSCGLPLPSSELALVAYDIAQWGTNVTIRLQDESLATCTLSGQVTPQGKQSEVRGTYTCSAGQSGLFELRRMEAGIDGFSGVFYSLSSAACANAPVTIGAARLP